MNLKEKLAIAQKSISSISRHEDEDANVRKAFMDELRKFIDGELHAIDAKVAERVAELSRG